MVEERDFRKEWKEKVGLMEAVDPVLISQTLAEIDKTRKERDQYKLMFEHYANKDAEREIY